MTPWLAPVVDVRPLRGVRFNPQYSGPVGPLIAPPYDVVAAPGASSEFSIRRIEGVDLGNGADNHRVAAERYREWLERGVLGRDDDPAIYIHRHEFPHHNVKVARTGILTRVRLSDWSERVVLPHERTNPGPREERFERLRMVGANLSPLYFLYRDPDGSIRDLIAESWQGAGVRAGTDHMGGTHHLIPVTDSAWHKRVSQAFADRTLFVADGHHRYEAALAYRDECRAAGESSADAPSEFVLALLAAVEDPGVLVRPTHRVLVGAGAGAPETVLATARAWFEVRAADGPMPGERDSFVGRLVLPDGAGIWDLYARPRKPHLDLVARDRGAAWRSLAVAGVEGLLDAMVSTGALPDGSRLLPVVDAAEGVRQVESGRAQAAFLLPEPGLDRLLAVAEEGDLLPAKSTWFEPKAPAGLVINDLRE
jgi:uncharacterized protein (DUF1015 family)